MSGRRQAKREGKQLVAEMTALLVPLGPVWSRPLFGGYGIYLEERIFALVGWGRLWLKVDAQTRSAFLAAGGEPFVYPSARGRVEMSYCTPPPEALASFETLEPWARRALEAAGRAAAAKRARRRRS